MAQSHSRSPDGRLSPPYVGDFSKMLAALSTCVFLPGNLTGRFVHDMLGVAEREIEGWEADRIIRLVLDYDRELPAEIVILAQDAAEARAFFAPLERLAGE